MAFPHVLINVIREVKHHVYVKREFVPRDQGSPLLNFNFNFNFNFIHSFSIYNYMIASTRV